MHTVCMGVAKIFLVYMYSSMQPAKRRIINRKPKQFKLPSELQRSVRGLDQISFFKASEFKTRLLYVAPVVIKRLLNETVNDLWWKFSCAIRLLLGSDKYLIECDQLKKDFCSGLGALVRAEQTFNLHSMRHLTWQVRNHSPLRSASSFAFESAHYSLASTITGSVNHLRLLVKWYLV